jgi:hypothetical protein
MSVTSTLPPYITATLASEIISAMGERDSSADLRKNLFVSPAQHLTLTLKNGSTSELNDIIVLGDLTITSESKDGIVGTLKARNLILAGKLRETYVNVHLKNQYIANHQFTHELVLRIFEWDAYQHEIVHQIGLRTILI